MLSEVEGTKLSFVVKHIKIFVILVVVNQLYSDFIFTVRKRTVFSILTLFNVGREVRTKLFLICLILVKLLNARMRISTLIAFGTLLTF